MKKSQIFLGASAFLLAISGALATKAGLKSIRHNAGVTVSGVCHRVGSLLLTTVQRVNPPINGKAHTTAGKTLYTVQAPVGQPTVCGKTLYTAAQN